MSTLVDRFEAVVRANMTLEMECATQREKIASLTYELKEVKSDLNEKRTLVNKLENDLIDLARQLSSVTSQLEMVGGKPTGSF